MSEQVEVCRRKAIKCVRAATLANDTDIRATYLDLARMWREMAEQVDELERRREGP